MALHRRDFLQHLTGFTAGTLLLPSFINERTAKKPFFDISLAQWSLHKTLFDKQMTNLDFPVRARKDFGIGAVEYVSVFFDGKQKDKTYLKELLLRCKDNGIKNHLIMIDRMGDLATKVKADRDQAVENHKQWVEAARYLGCKSIRINLYGAGTAQEMHDAAVDGMGRLAEFAKPFKINIIVENHGGNSSNGVWVANVMKAIHKKNVGTLPDFGNFCLEWGGGQPWVSPCTKEYDRYQGVQEMMPYAKGVSAKAMDFDQNGNCVETDYVKMLKIVKDAGFRGYMGIEYSASGSISEPDGIRLTKALLERVGGELA
jgi:hydroxypyruvate isomerase